MKLIERGMTEAVTRDGRKVTQLTWFDVDETKEPNCVAGVIDGQMRLWMKDGKCCILDSKYKLDIFAPVEHEWQWLFQHQCGTFDTTGYCKTEQHMLNEYNRHGRHNFKRIEESKREVKK